MDATHSTDDSGFVANIIVHGGKMFGFDFHTPQGETISKANARRLMEMALEAIDETIDGMSE